MATASERMVNREISWLSFNDRVLQEAADPSVPLIERLRFLGIFSNNRDEFFRVRVATVKRMVRFDKKGRHFVGGTPKEVLNQIQELVIKQEKRFNKIYQELIKELQSKDVYLINETELNEKQEKFVRNYFEEKIHPILVPIMVGQLRKFPYLKDKSIYLAVKLHNREEGKKPEYAMLEVPSSKLGRFVVLPTHEGKKYIIILDDVIRACLDRVFAIFGFSKIEAYTFKITRDAELDIDNDVSQSFLEKMRRSLKQRKSGDPVRFVYDREMPEDLLRFLTRKMKIDSKDDHIWGGRYHNFKDFIGFPNVGPVSFEHPKLLPLPHKDLDGEENIMAVLRRKDVMLHYPYQSFSYIITWLREAAIDPKVKFIKICLYRVASDSKVINALISAAKNGKDVTVVVELQARFDEEANIYWSNILQEEGVKVIHGVPGLKVHSKMTLIGRKEGGKIRYYANFGTGNYHEKTARIYGDVSLLTADKRLTNEAERVFSIFENVYRPSYYYKHLLLSPMHLRNKLVRLINYEIRSAKAGEKASMILKMNSLVDPQLIRKLYEASKAGVQIKLIVRGICSLVPGVAGLSENIEAISILDKYLEHARVYVFYHGGQELCYISSADWMGRNLDHRIEVTCPIYDEEIKREMIDFLEIQLQDNVKARVIDPHGKNRYKKAKPGSRKVRTQVELRKFYKKTLERGEK